MAEDAIVADAIVAIVQRKLQDVLREAKFSAERVQSIQVRKMGSRVYMSR